MNRKLLAACENFIHIKQGYSYHTYRQQGYAKKHLNDAINIIKAFKPESSSDNKAVPQENSSSEQRLIQFYTDLGLNVVASASEQV